MTTTEVNTKPVKEVRITDRHVLRSIDLERIRRGDSTSTKTAQALITERLAQLEMRRDPIPEEVATIPAPGRSR